MTTPQILLALFMAVMVATIGAALWMVFRGPRLVGFLVRRYLWKRRIAWVSLIAVTLCTVMVLVVISVMGGWLRMFRDSFHGLSGDIVIQGHTLTGFPYYQEMIDKIENLPEVEAAAPVIKAYGLINIQDNQASDGVQVLGFTDKIGRINRFGESLYRQYQKPIEQADDKTNDLTPVQRDALQRLANTAARQPSFTLPLPAEDYRDDPKFARQWQNKLAQPDKFKNVRDPATLPGMIGGAGVLHIHKDETGAIVNRSADLYQIHAKLTVMPLERNGDLAETAPPMEYFWIVDDSRTKVWQYDNNTVYVPFDTMQKLVGMRYEGASPEDDPPRTSEIHVKLRPGVDLNGARTKVEDAVNAVVDAHPKFARYLEVQTWEQVNALWLGAIEKETLLVTFLFSLISIVAIFLIFCIFYMIVVEKTKDIGIIKSVGATSSGVAGIFLGYGLAIGIVGGGAGFFIGYLIVRYINELHQLFGRLTGQQIWNPEVYAFDTIPNTVNPKEVMVIVAVAIASAVLGAVIPAIRAARMNPVESLRWE